LHIAAPTTPASAMKNQETDMQGKTLAALFAGLLFAPVAAVLAQTATVCPPEVKARAQCYTGADQNGATYWIAIPDKWNKVLVMHAHGGPRTQAIDRDSVLPDLRRFAVTVNQGFAWAASSYRRPGYGVRMAVEDTENLRKLFVQQFGKPLRTILHGQSWGGNVAAKGIELYGGTRNYDGVMLTSGVIAGGTRAYLHRADLRAVYQYYCHNHPRPDEPQYPVWRGLPAEAKMTVDDLEERVNECTGIKLPAAKRSEQQRRNLANILGVVPIPERTFMEHMRWSTFMFRDMVQNRLGERNPFSNAHVAYHGSSDDAALNRGVERFGADPQAVAELAYDADMSGDIKVPVITMHAIDDPTALVEYESAYKDVVTRAGRQDKLLQTFTDEHEHSKLADPEYAALLDTLMRWIDTGSKPTVDQVAADCAKQKARFHGGCHFDAKYTPKPLFERVAPR
jgi:alpha-beta hydrolase superfamily lysophospholipase